MSTSAPCPVISQSRASSTFTSYQVKSGPLSARFCSAVLILLLAFALPGFSQATHPLTAKPHAQGLTSGTITTIVGNGTAGYTGDGFAAINAELRGPADVIYDQAGDLFISDNGNSVIREVNPAADGQHQ
jgi:hypothetical protein